MPYIHAQISIPITDQQRGELVSALGRHISLFEGKTEHGLMLTLTDRCDMYHGGASCAAACLEVRLFGAQAQERYLDFTKAVCETCQQLLKIPPEHVYITYLTATAWGNDFNNS